MRRLHLIIAGACVVLGAGVLLYAQQVANYWIPAWNGIRYEWLRLGQTFVVRSGAVEVSLPAQERIYGAKVRPDAQGRWALPDRAENLVVHVNGIRAAEGIDYSVGVVEGSDRTQIIPLWAWDPSYCVVVDYDRR